MFTAQRSGIEISTDIDYPIRSAIDPIVFGVVGELLSNVVQHSRARHASVTLGITDDICVLDVADDGAGVTSELWRAAWVKSCRAGSCRTHSTTDALNRSARRCARLGTGRA